MSRKIFQSVSRKDDFFFLEIELVAKKSNFFFNLEFNVIANFEVDIIVST